MKIENSNATTVKINISRDERISARHLAKSQGMTFQGWLGLLIRRELKKAEVQNGTRD